MIQSTNYEITTKKFFQLLNNQADNEEHPKITKAIDKLKSNIYNDSDDNIRLDSQKIYTCFEETSNGIIQLIETDNISRGLQAVINNLLLEQKIKNLLQHILIHFTLNPSIDLMEIGKSMELIHEAVHEDASVCFCVSYDNSKNSNQIEIDCFLFHKTK